MTYGILYYATRIEKAGCRVTILAGLRPHGRAFEEMRLRVLVRRPYPGRRVGEI
jgi:hypothetical protein